MAIYPFQIPQTNTPGVRGPAEHPVRAGQGADPRGRDAPAGEAQGGGSVCGWIWYCGFGWLVVCCGRRRGARSVGFISRTTHTPQREWIVTAIEASSHLHQQPQPPQPPQQPPSRPPSRQASKGARGGTPTPPPRPPPLAHTYCEPTHPPLKKACRPLQGE